MRVSESGRTLIARNEGCVLHAYRDVVGVWTIGYGHTAGVSPGQRITQQQADDLLAQDLDNVYGPRVEKLLAGSATTQPQFDAMVSLAYNIGPGDWINGRIDRYDKGGFEDSSVLKHHLRGEYEAAADSFRLWNKAGGRFLAALARRREEERALYLSGVTGQPRAPDIADPHPVLRRGATGDAVREAQRRLAALGFDPGPVDGSYGPRTEGAVSAFQEARLILIPGVVARSTWNELAQAEAERSALA